MKAIIAEDDFTSRILLQALLQPYGICHISVNGKEVVEAIRSALDAGEPYDLVCLDIMMPEADGQTALKDIRALESTKGILPSDGVKIIMTTALSDKRNIMSAFKEQCDAYLVKPIEKEKLEEDLKKLGFIK